MVVVRLLYSILMRLLPEGRQIMSNDATARASSCVALESLRELCGTHTEVVGLYVMAPWVSTKLPPSS